jgi:soluble lytic murein transglycosylase-like protein
MLIALGMIAPGGAFMARARMQEWDRPAAQPMEPTHTPDNVARDVVAEAWQDAALNREREQTSARYAARFKIPLELANQIHGAAVEADIDPQIAFGLVRAESNFRTKAVSPVGALGLTQLMPSTARWLEPGTSRRELFDPRTNLRVGFSYLRQLLDDYDGNEHLALTAYNRGPGTVNRLLKRGRDPGNGYAELVMTGRSDRHTALMKKKFGRRGARRS